MAVRSKRLVAFRTSTAGVDTTVYTAGPDETVLVKFVQLFWRQATLGQLRLILDTTVTSATGLRYWDAPAQFASDSWWPWLVLQPGDSLIVHCTVTNGAHVVISGAELEGVAD